MTDRSKKIKIEFLFTILAIFCLGAVFWFTDIDMELQRYFYKDGQGWFLGKTSLVRVIYKWGIIPAILAAIYSLILLVMSYKNKKYYKYRKLAAFVFLLFTLGPGLVINGVLKTFWGRPRPRHMVEFGGIRKYIKAGLISREYAKPNSSFPCGHASVAFFFFFPFFIYRKTKKGIAFSFLVFGIIYGLVMGLVRMIQGGHFASDVFWSGAITYLIALSLYYILKMDERIKLEE